MVLLPFHASVLEPDFDLSLAEAKRVGDLYSAPPGEIPVKVKLLLELEDLLSGVRRPRSLVVSIKPRR